MQYWRSEGLEVVVTASSGKAARYTPPSMPPLISHLATISPASRRYFLTCRLIGGVTVHRAFGLNDKSGLFQRSNLEHQMGTERFALLARADVIIIDGASAPALDLLCRMLAHLSPSGCLSQRSRCSPPTRCTA